MAEQPSSATDITKELKGVRSAESVTVADIERLFLEATSVQQSAFLYFLRAVKQVPGIELKVRNQGIGGYGVDVQGKRRECFHFGIHKAGPRLVVCQHAQVLDPRNVFSDEHPSGKYLSGYISGADPGENTYVLRIFLRSYTKITGIEAGPRLD